MFESLVMMVCGYLIATAIMNYFNRLRQKNEEEIAELEAELEKRARIIPVKVEIYHDCYYLFRDDNDSFVAQGRNVTELIENLRLRFHRVSLDLVGGEPADVERLETELRDTVPETVSTPS